MLYMLGITWEQLEKRLYIVKNHSINTKQGQRVLFNKINEYFMHYPFNEETIYDYISTLKNKGLANGTINNYAKLLKHICHILHVDYMREFTYRKDRGSNIVAWTQPELDRLVKAAYSINFRVGVIVQTLYETAIRNSEICNLTIKDFNGYEFKLMETKAQEIQYAQILPPLSKKIYQLIDYIKLNHKNEYIFGSFKGKMDRSTLNTYIRQAAELTGIKKDIRAHIIRHSICTLATKRNVNLFKVQQYMRHKDIGTTLRYTHLDKNDVREVAETIATESMSFELISRRIKDFRDQFPNLPYKISLTESKDKIVLEVCNNINENLIDSTIK